MSAAQGFPTARTRGGAEANLVARLVAVGFAAVILQLSLFSGLRLVSGDIDILPLVALTAGFLAGPAGGAATGFGRDPHRQRFTSRRAGEKGR